jgi:hypothetical protein
MPRTFGPAVVLVAAGALFVLAAFRGDGLAFGTAALLSLYCLGLLFIGILLWWEATRRRTGVLPSWTSPPVLIAGWTLAWIYMPALVAFLDDDLLDDLTLARGGEGVLLTGLPLTCCALAVLSLSYHVTTLALGRRVQILDRAERLVPLRWAVALYVASVAARALRLVSLGVAFGSDLAAWGPLQSVDQWIGYVEDLRFLALTLLVAHAMRRRGGYLWLGIALIVEVVLGVSSGFLTPVLLPIVLCVATAAAFDRLRLRHIALMATAGLLVSTFVPVIAAIRQDRMGAVGTADLVDVGDVLTAPGKYWLAGVSAGDGVYDKFFGRQAEVASAPGLVVMFTPAVVPYEGLERFLALPASLIPRALWPDKPTLSRGVWFSSTFRGLPEDTTSYSAMTIFSEGYLFYGWTGTVLAMLIAGALLAVVRRRLDNPRLVLVYLALVPTILQIEPELSSYLTTLVQRSVVFLVVFVLLRQANTEDFRHQPIRA